MLLRALARCCHPHPLAVPSVNATSCTRAMYSTQEATPAPAAPAAPASSSVSATPSSASKRPASSSSSSTKTIAGSQKGRRSEKSLRKQDPDAWEEYSRKLALAVDEYRTWPRAKSVEEEAKLVAEEDARDAAERKARYEQTLFNLRSRIIAEKGPLFADDIGSLENIGLKQEDFPVSQRLDPALMSTPLYAVERTAFDNLPVHINRKYDRIFTKIYGIQGDAQALCNDLSTIVNVERAIVNKRSGVIVIKGAHDRIIKEWLTTRGF